MPNKKLFFLTFFVYTLLKEKGSMPRCFLGVRTTLAKKFCFEDLTVSPF